MFQRRTSGSVVCPSCGSLVGVRDEKCYTCGRANPGLWGFAPVLRQLGADLGSCRWSSAPATCSTSLTLLASGSELADRRRRDSHPGAVHRALLLFGASGAIRCSCRARWWTVLSASWLHGGLLHIFFNMMWVRHFGPAIG